MVVIFFYYIFSKKFEIYDNVKNNNNWLRKVLEF